MKTAKGYAIAKMLGVPNTMLTSAELLDVAIEFITTSPTMLKISSGNLHQSIPMKAQIITLAENGTLGPASKAALAKQIKSALEHVVSGNAPDVVIGVPSKPNIIGVDMAKDYTSMDYASLSPGKKAAFTKQMKKMQFTGKNATAAAIGSAPSAQSSFQQAPKVASKNNLPSNAPVKLAAASTLYQLVTGTSSGSKYRLLARFKNLNIAARYEGNTLSLRAEGSGLYDYKSELESIGFSLKTSYGSAHLQTSGLLMQKTFGALIGALGFGNMLEVGNPDVLA